MLAASAAEGAVAAPQDHNNHNNNHYHDNNHEHNKQQPPASPNGDKRELGPGWEAAPEPASKRPKVDPSSERDGACGVGEAKERRLDVHFPASSSKLAVDGLVVKGDKGYRMARASHSCEEGEWYFEVEVLEGGQGHCRVGWSTESGDLQMCVGADQHSFAYRDTANCLCAPRGDYGRCDSARQREGKGQCFHDAVGRDYGQHYGPGDVIGCLIVMHEQDGTWQGRVEFAKNGVTQGVAFDSIPKGVYFPAVSLYRSASVRLNGGPSFKFPPTFFAKANPQPIANATPPSSSVEGGPFLIAPGRLGTRVPGAPRAPTPTPPFTPGAEMDRPAELVAKPEGEQAPPQQEPRPEAGSGSGSGSGGGGEEGLGSAKAAMEEHVVKTEPPDGDAVQPGLEDPSAVQPTHQEQ